MQHEIEDRVAALQQQQQEAILDSLLLLPLFAAQQFTDVCHTHGACGRKDAPACVYNDCVCPCSCLSHCSDGNASHLAAPKPVLSPTLTTSSKKRPRTSRCIPTRPPSPLHRCPLRWSKGDGHADAFHLISEVLRSGKPFLSTQRRRQFCHRR